MSHPALPLLLRHTSRYVGSLAGFDPDEKQEVEALIRRGLAREETQKAIRDLATREGMSKEAANAFAVNVGNTVSTRELKYRAARNVDQPFYIIQADSPARSVDAVQDWRNVFATIDLVHLRIGSGFWSHPGSCDGCHGGTHPTGLCEFPKLPGWIGPDLAPSHAPVVDVPAAPAVSFLPQAPPRPKTKAQNDGGEGNRPTHLANNHRNNHGGGHRQQRATNNVGPARPSKHNNSDSHRTKYSRSQSNPAFRAFNVDKLTLPRRD